MPSVVTLFAIVGFADMFQQIPREVTAVPPSLVIFPPLVKEVSVIEVISAGC